MAKMDRFDGFLPSGPPTAPWDASGNYAPDYDLLLTLLGVAVGTAQQSGIVAAAADTWAAEELRRAGFDLDEVWPRRKAPRVMPRDVKALVERGLTKKLRQDVEARFDKQGARKALPAEANLRGRHPLAALGFLYILGADAPEEAKSFAIDMLRKLVTEPDVYDCACLLVLDGAQGIIKESEAVPEGRGAREEPASLVPAEPDDAEDDDDGDDESDEVLKVKVAPVALLHDQVPEDLSAGPFFDKLIRSALARTPVAMYPAVRERTPEKPTA
jgi:hypothetical protein